MIRLLSMLLGITMAFTTTGCAIGFLLFYRDARTVDVYRNNRSKKDYYTIQATTLSHCGCTYLAIDNYINKKRTFTIHYNYNNEALKTIYTFNNTTQQPDTIRLIATTNSHFSVAFDSLDLEIFRRIDTIARQKPKGIVYEIKTPDYKGYNRVPAYY